MRSSPLLLKDYFTTSLSFSAQPEFKSSGNFDARNILVSDLKVNVEQSKQEDNPLQRSCYLSIELDDPSGTKYPCSFSISLVGFFEIIPEWPTEQVDVLFSANAPALLYSAAREALATVTGRSPFRAILLPSITFVQRPLPQPKKDESELAPPIREHLPEGSADVVAKSNIEPKKNAKKPPSK